MTDSAADRKRLQMADIARLAGVSVSTVSRALNGSTLVNEETRERVGQLARSLNYSINLSAQNLRLQKNQTVAVVVPYDARARQHISDPFFLSIVGAIADALTDRGHDMLLSRVDADRLDSASALYDSGKAIGIIIIGQWRHHDQLNELAARKVPVVVWGGKLPQQLYCSVGGDNITGGALATRHLLQQGRKRIVFVGDAQLPEVQLRRQGYHLALREAGISPDAKLEVPAPFDVAVVGYDDMPLAPWSDPPLTTVHQPVALAGAELVDALLTLLRGERAAPRTLPVHLVVRDSAPVVAPR